MVRPLSWLRCRGWPLSGCSSLVLLALAHSVLRKMLMSQGLGRLQFLRVFFLQGGRLDGLELVVEQELRVQWELGDGTRSKGRAGARAHQEVDTSGDTGCVA